MLTNSAVKVLSGGLKQEHTGGLSLKQHDRVWLCHRSQEHANLRARAEDSQAGSPKRLRIRSLYSVTDSKLLAQLRMCRSNWTAWLLLLGCPSRTRQFQHCGAWLDGTLGLCRQVTHDTEIQLGPSLEASVQCTTGEDAFIQAILCRENWHASCARSPIDGLKQECAVWFLAAERQPGDSSRKR